MERFFRSLLIVVLFYSSNVRAVSVQYGDVMQIAIPAGALAASLIIDDLDGSKQLVKSYTTTMLATYSSKAAFRNSDIGLRPDRIRRDSFFSGHTSSAFSGASYVHFRYGIVYGLPLYILSAGVAKSRVDAKQHNTRDVICGAVFSTLISYYFVSKYDSGVNLSIEPTSNNISFSISKKF